MNKSQFDYEEDKAVNTRDAFNSWTWCSWLLITQEVIHLFLLVCAKQPQMAVNEVCIGFLQRCTDMLAMQTNQSLLKGRTVLKHSMHLWLIYIICDWIVYLKIISQVQQSCNKDRGKWLDYKRMQIHKKQTNYTAWLGRITMTWFLKNHKIDNLLGQSSNAQFPVQYWLRGDEPKSLITTRLPSSSQNALQSSDYFSLITICCGSQKLKV